MTSRIRRLPVKAVRGDNAPLTCKGTEYDSAIDRDMTEGNGFSVNGTPTFFVGKTTTQGIDQQRLGALLK